MMYNMTLQPMRTDEKVEGTLKFQPVGVWEGTGQQVEVNMSEEVKESAKITLVGGSLVLASMLFLIG